MHGMIWFGGFACLALMISQSWVWAQETCNYLPSSHLRWYRAWMEHQHWSLKPTHLSIHSGAQIFLWLLVLFHCGYTVSPDTMYQEIWMFQVQGLPCYHFEIPKPQSERLQQTKLNCCFMLWFSLHATFSVLYQYFGTTCTISNQTT